MRNVVEKAKKVSSHSMVPEFSGRGPRLVPIAPIAGASDSLTKRETEVLALIANGNSNRQIACNLGISPKTVACHRERILGKLRAHNTADLTRAAIRMRLVEP